MVTREELKKRLWPSDTFVDFDQSLNRAVNRLREALDDSADAPRYIETLPRRGYRFILPVAGTFPEAQPIAVVLPAPAGAGRTSEPGPDITVANVTRTPDSALTVSRRSRWIRPIAVSVLIIAVGATLGWLGRPFSPPRVLSTTQLTHDGFSKTGILTDGSRLYITESTGSRQFLVQASATGGETTVIPTPFASIVTSDISPDHSQMLVAEAVGPKYEFQVWVLPIPGGTPRRLGDIVARCDTWSSQGWATWSPDGRQLAFAKSADIYMANADGSNARRLTTLSGYASEIRFSPDGSHLRFTLRSLKNNMSSSIWDVRADGSDLHPLLPGWRSSFSHMAGDWSRDGRYYFFTSAGNPNRASIWAMREPTGLWPRRASRPVELTTGPMPVYFNGLSPDGKRIFAGGWTSRSELVRYDATSHQFVPFLGGISADELDFSRDGKWAAYVSIPDGTLWRSRVDGSERLQLTVPPVSASAPHWSADGMQIAFVDKQAGPFWKLYLIPSQGGTPQEMFSENQYQMDPSWSPDGKQLVFGRVPWLWGSAEKIAIQILDLDSKHVSTVPGSQNLFAPRWSPDGRYLAALSTDSKKLVLFDFVAKKWTDWINEAGSIGYPTWSRDGTYIYYDSMSTDNPGYRRVKLGQTRSQFLVDLKRLNRGGPDYASGLGPWSGLAPDGSALFGHYLSSDEVYSLEVDLP